MFERFTDRARRVLVLAQEEARLLDHDFIGTEHLLLGLIREGDGLAAIALKSLDISLEGVRREVEKAAEPSGPTSVGSPSLTPRAKKVLELSLREALQLDHRYIGTEHLLLGLVREGESAAAHVLVTLGADLARVRQEVVALVAGSPPPGAAGTVRGQPPWGVPQGSERGVGPNSDGPRCPTCRSLLDGHVGYRVLAVSPVGRTAGADDIDVMFVYCRQCGVMLAHTPAGEIGLGSGAPEPVTVARVSPGRTAERLIAEGVTDDGVRWTLRAGGDDGNYATMLRTEDAAGVIDSGGMGGPKLWGSDRLNVYSGGNPQRGPQAIVVRADPSVELLSVVYEDGTEAEMVAGGTVDGLRFGVLLVAPDARLREVVGRDRERMVIERFDLRGHGAAWRRHRPE